MCLAALRVAVAASSRQKGDRVGSSSMMIRSRSAAERSIRVRATVSVETGWRSRKPHSPTAAWAIPDPVTLDERLSMPAVLEER